MPKVCGGANYIKKYTEEDVQKAIEAVQNGMPKKTAAAKFGVPRPTLQFRLSSLFVKSKPGPKTVLTEEEEKILVEWIIVSCRKGFPKRKEDILLSVEQFLTNNPRNNCFIENKPGEGWYRLFLKRHPEITHRTAEAVTAASANISKTNIGQWFAQIKQYLQENDLIDILQDPSRVYNGDETNFQLCPKNNKVLALKGTKNVYEVDHAKAKSCLTVMFTFAANGEITPPLVIYPLKRMRADIRASVPSHWGLGLSENGWMNKDLFLQYINNIFYPYLVEKKVQFPILMFLDGHKSHLNYMLSESCKEKGIILIALYPNSTRILQPADVSAFKPMKNAWKKSVLDWRRSNLTKTLTKLEFGPILKSALDKHIKKDSIINGFKACGLFPWNPNAINFSKCLGRSSSSAINTPTVSNEPNIMLNVNKFEEIVGQTILDNLQHDKLEKSHDDIFHDALLRLYQFLKTGTENAIEKVQENPADSLLIHDEWYNIDDVPIVINEDPPIDILPNDLFEDENIPLDATCDLLSGIESNGNRNKQQNTDSEHCLPRSNPLPRPPESQICLPKIINETNNTDLTHYLTESLDLSQHEALETPLKIGNPTNIPKVPLSQVHTPVTQTPEKNTLKNSLIWPKTPVRKGRQLTNKPIFVLTSNEWLKIEKNKLDEKEKKENEKLERKRQREENKSKNIPKKKKTKAKKNNTSKQDIDEIPDIDDDLPLSAYKTPTKHPKNEDTDCKPVKTTTVKYRTEKENKIKDMNIIATQTTGDQLSQKKFIPKRMSEIKVKFERVATMPQLKPNEKRNISIQNVITVNSRKTIPVLPKPVKEKQERKNVTNQYVYTVNSPKDFVLPKPSKKVLERKATFRNEKELADFLNKSKD